MPVGLARAGIFNQPKPETYFSNDISVRIVDHSGRLLITLSGQCTITAYDLTAGRPRFSEQREHSTKCALGGKDIGRS